MTVSNIDKPIPTNGNHEISDSYSKKTIKFDGRITEGIPVDIYLKIFKQLQTSDIIALSSTNKAFHKLLKDYSILEKRFLKKIFGHNVTTPEIITSDYQQKTMAAFIKNNSESEADMLSNRKSTLAFFYFHHHRQMTLSQQYQLKPNGEFQHSLGFLNLSCNTHLNSTADHVLLKGLFIEEVEADNTGNPYVTPPYTGHKYGYRHDNIDHIRKAMIWGKKQQSANNNWQQQISTKLADSTIKNCTSFNLAGRHALVWSEDNVTLFKHHSDDSWHEDEKFAEQAKFEGDQKILTVCSHPSKHEILIVSATEAMILNRKNLSKSKISPPPTRDLFPLHQFNWHFITPKLTHFNNDCCLSLSGNYAALTGDHFICICSPDGNEKWSVIKTFIYKNKISSISFSKSENYLLVCILSISTIHILTSSKKGDWHQIETLKHSCQRPLCRSRLTGASYNEAENEILAWGDYGLIIWKPEHHGEWSYQQIADYKIILCPTNAYYDYSNNYILAKSHEGTTPRLFQRNKDDSWSRISILYYQTGTSGNVIFSRSRRHMLQTCSTAGTNNADHSARVWGLDSNKNLVLKGTINHGAPIDCANFNDLETHIVTVSFVHNFPGAKKPGTTRIWAIIPEIGDNETNTVTAASEIPIENNNETPELPDTDISLATSGDSSIRLLPDPNETMSGTPLKTESEIARITPETPEDNRDGLLP